MEDWEVQLMYYLFLLKGMKPMEYHNAGPGERRILHAFLLQELEDRKEMNKG